MMNTIGLKPNLDDLNRIWSISVSNTILIIGVRNAIKLGRLFQPRHNF